jgi:hypothetical protein
MLKSTVPKSTKIFSCENCDYTTSRHSHWLRHVSTSKHFCQQNQHFSNENSVQKVPESTKNWLCECGKEYKDRSGLWRHKKQCTYIKEEHDNMVNETEKAKQEFLAMSGTELVMQLLKQNNELHQQLIEMSKEKSTIYNTINNNNKLNIHVYLNEQCKDALNMSEFVDSIKLQLSDLENTGRVGFIKGVSQIFTRELNNIDECRRPIHCTNLRNEIFYIKEDNQWSKEDENNEKFVLAIKQIAHKNFKQLPLWTAKHPDYLDPESKTNDIYNHMLCNIISGGTPEENKQNYAKIIKNVAKNIVLNKQNLICN